MKKMLIFGLMLLFPTLAIAGGALPGSITRSSLTADDTTSSVDAYGFDKIDIQVVFATCTGAAADTGDLIFETSNNNLNWSTVLTIIDADSGLGLSGTTVRHYVPDGATADEGGFGRYIRFKWDEQGGSPNISYTVYYTLKD